MATDESSLNQLLRTLRDQKQLPVEQVARFARAARSTVYSWESLSNPSPPTPAHLKAVLDLYNPSPTLRRRAWELLGLMCQERDGHVTTPVEPRGTATEAAAVA